MLDRKLYKCTGRRLQSWRNNFKYKQIVKSEVGRYQNIKEKAENERNRRLAGNRIGGYLVSVSYTHLDVYKRQS